MANPFEVPVVNPLQALLIGQKAYTDGAEANKQQALTDARAAAAQSYQAGDTKGALAKLLMGGDLQGAGTYSSLDNNAWTRAHTEKTDARTAARDAVTDQHWSADFGLRKAANDRAGEDKFSLQKVDNPDGTSTIVRVKTTGPEGPISTGVTPQPPGNPFAVTGPKLNADQAKSATMVDRMNQANNTLIKNEGINDGLTGKPMGLAQAIPYVRDSALFNVIASPERQQVVQAQRNFVNAILRVESGAAINKDEFDNSQRQYFPQVGDSQAVIAQKRQNRVTAMQGMAREAGAGYKPPADLVNAGKPSPTDPLGIR